MSPTTRTGLLAAGIVLGGATVLLVAVILANSGGASGSSGAGASGSLRGAASGGRLSQEQAIAWEKLRRHLPPYAIGAYFPGRDGGQWKVLGINSPSEIGSGSLPWRTRPYWLFTYDSEDDVAQSSSWASQPNIQCIVALDLRTGPSPVATAWFADRGNGPARLPGPLSRELQQSLDRFLLEFQIAAGE